MKSNNYCKLFKKSRYTILQLFDAQESENPAALKESVFKIINEKKHTIINCACMTDISAQWIQDLKFLEQQLKLAEKSVQFVYMSDQLRTKLKGFTTAGTLRRALSELHGLVTSFSDMNLIKVLVNATMYVLYMQAKQLQCTRGSVALKTSDNNELMGDISGVIKVHTSDFDYAIILSFPEQTFIALMNRMLDEQSSNINKENSDGAAELMNIIFGHAKLVLNQKSNKLKASIPQIHLGRNLTGFNFDRSKQLTPFNAGKTVVIPFTSEIGTFYVEVWFPESAQKMLLN